MSPYLVGIVGSPTRHQSITFPARFATSAIMRESIENECDSCTNPTPSGKLVSFRFFSNSTYSPYLDSLGLDTDTSSLAFNLTFASTLDRPLLPQDLAQSFGIWMVRHEGKFLP